MSIQPITRLTLPGGLDVVGIVAPFMPKYRQLLQKGINRNNLQKLNHSLQLQLNSSSLKAT